MLGRVDLVVANAGVMYGAPFEQADTSEWQQMLDVNVGGLLNTGRAFIDDLLAAAADGRPADLVHVGSVGGHQLFPSYGVYCATKAAVEHLTRNLRLDLGPRGVRVKSIEPGIVTHRARRRSWPHTTRATRSRACAPRSSRWTR